METIRNEEKTKLDLQREGSNGKIEACKQCSGFVCCGILKEGGVIEPPYLTKHDIKQIEYYTGLQKGQFAFEKKNPVTENTIFVMQIIESNGCVFFNRDDGKCQIYSFRPMDCRLFPLDIEVKDFNYYWALFKYDKCRTTGVDLKSLLKYKEKALIILDEELHEYATYPVPGMKKIGYDEYLTVK